MAKAVDFISDEDMAKMAPKSSTTPDFIPDEEITPQQAPMPAPALQQSQMGQAMARSYGEGGAFGFSGEIGGAAEAAVGTLQGLVTGQNPFGDEGRLESLKNFGSNYARARDELDRQREVLSTKHPIASAVGEIGGFMAGGVASAPKLAAKGLGMISQGAATGGLSALGKSEKESIKETATDVATGAAVGAAVSGAAKALFGGSAPSIIKKKNGNIAINYGTSSKDAFELGAEQGQKLINPNAQAAIKAELDAVTLDGLPAAIKQNFKSVGQKWDGEISKWGAQPVKTNKILESMYNTVDSIAPEGDDLAVTGKEALKQRVDMIKNQLLSKSPTQSLDDVPLSELAKAQEEFGALVRGQKAYARSPQVNGVAKQTLGKLIKGFEAEDAVASGGELSKLNKAFSKLYDMRDAAESINGSTIKSWTNPMSSQSDKFTALVKPFSENPELSPLLADSYNFIMNNLAKSIKKAQIADTVLKAQKSDASLFSPRGVMSFSSSIAPNIANRAGASPITRTAVQAVGRGLPSLAGAAAPSALDRLNR